MGFIKVVKKKNKKTICFDLDGTLCTTTNGDYDKAKPKRKAILRVNKLYEEGNKITIFTARFMGRYGDNPTKAKKAGYLLTLKQLKKWNIKYHRLVMGKPSYDILIDDKAFSYSKNWIKKNF